MRYAEDTPSEFETGLHTSMDMPVQVVRFMNEMDVLSSAIHFGGRVRTDTVIFVQVPKDSYDWCKDVEGHVISVLDGLGLPHDTVVLLTAAEVDKVFTVESSTYKGRTGYAAVTAGLSNQVIAGDELTDWEGRHRLSNERSKELYMAGTINVMSIYQEPLDHSAKVNAVINATEAKTAALNILGYSETGTTSDAVAIVSPVGDTCPYAGTGSDHGIASARAVRAAVCKALIKRNDFPVDMDSARRTMIKKEFGF